jgi:hypothetical protein
MIWTLAIILILFGLFVWVSIVDDVRHFEALEARYKEELSAFKGRNKKALPPAGLCPSDAKANEQAID